MPDISMCKGADCSLKEKCYRYKATPNPYRQAYFMNPPLEDDKCDYFMNIEK